MTYKFQVYRLLNVIVVLTMLLSPFRVPVIPVSGELAPPASPFINNESNLYESANVFTVPTTQDTGVSQENLFVRLDNVTVNIIAEDEQETAPTNAADSMGFLNQITESSKMYLGESMGTVKTLAIR